MLGAAECLAKGSLQVINDLTLHLLHMLIDQCPVLLDQFVLGEYAITSDAADRAIFDLGVKLKIFAATSGADHAD